ncbi:hypothetical protein [Clostridium tertium]|uniref:Uncharacterized protein n=1 Tax=Clostridium tertium TaxID=1559 RepID=A0A6N2YAV3_9CLOT
MLYNKCYCEKCRKIQKMIVNSKKATKDLNIGKIEYNKLYGTCEICGEEVYSIDLNKRNNIEIINKIKELEEEIALMKIIDSIKVDKDELNIKNTKILDYIKESITNKNKDKQ